MAKYNHLLFEELIFSEQELTSHENAELQAHVQECEDCRQLSEAWQAVENQLTRTPAVAPVSGFTRRWQTRLALDLQKQHHRQTNVVLLVSLFGALTLFLLLIVLGMPLLQTPWPFILTLIYQYTVYLSSVSYAASAITKIMRAVFDIVPPTLWVGIMIAMASLGALWIISLKKLILSRRIIQ